MERGQADDFEFSSSKPARAGSIRAARGQDRAAVIAETRAVQLIVVAFQKAAQGRRLYADPGSASHHIDHMHRSLKSYLADHPFLMLRVTSGGFRFRGNLLPGDERRDLPALLAERDIAEVWFRRGVTPAEIRTFLELIEREQQTRDDVTPLATILWEANLRHIRCVCTDELPGETPRLVALNEALPAGHGGPETTAWSRRFDGAITAPVTAVEAKALPKAASLNGDAAIAQVGLLAIETLACDPDASCREAALDLLRDVIEATLAQGRIVPTQTIVSELRKRAIVVPDLNAVLFHVEEVLCRQPNVMTMGRMLDNDEADASLVAAARALLASLQGAIDPLCTLLGQLENIQARKLVCRVLATVAGDTPGALAQRANGQPWYVVRNMAFVMGRIGTTAVVPFLRRWIGHEDARVRIEVARALGRVQHASASTLLCELLQDDEVRVRQCAVWSLAALGDAAVLPRLRTLLFDDRSFRSRSADERDDFFRTYGRIADTAAYEELTRLLDQRSLVSVGWQSELRRGAALALGETGRPQAARLLQEHAAARDTRLRDACTEALQSLRTRGREAARQGDHDTWHPARTGHATPDSGGFHLEVDDAF